MSTADVLHQAQIANWDGPMGEVWAASEARSDKALRGVSTALFRVADVEPGEAVLDVGCGGGATTEQLAMDVGSTGRVVGLDVSKTLIAIAQKRLDGTGQAEFIQADASTIAFPKTMFDVLFSRFGVMFFGDPVAAFANLHKAMKPEGRLAFACWRASSDNPWVSIPLRAAMTVVPAFPRPGPEDPGPFAFGDQARVSRILTEAGFSGLKFKQFDFTMDFTGTGLDAARAVSGVGPLGRILRDQPDDVKARAMLAVADALVPFTVDDGVKLPASVWLVSGSAS